MSGILAALTLPASTTTDIYECPAGNTVTAIVSCANTSGLQCQVRLSVQPFGGTAKVIEPDSDLKIRGVLDRGGIVLGAGDKIIGFCNQAIDVAVWGYKE